MDELFRPIISNVEPLLDSIYGPRYRCALTLKDGTFLPCAVLQSKDKLIELAKRRIREEESGDGMFSMWPDPYGEILKTFVAGGNRVNDYDVASTRPSKYAIPSALLNQIRGETTMGWTGWVFEMKDGALFQYGSGYHMEFFQLPDEYSFDDVLRVHNHSFLSREGGLVSLERGSSLPPDYRPSNLLRDRIFFTCYIDGIEPH